MNETTFDDTSLREKSSNNQKESEINSIDDDSISKQHETTASNQDENVIPDIHDPNKFFNDDWFNLLPSNDLLNQQSTFSQKIFFGHKMTLSKFHYLNYFMRSKHHYTLLIKLCLGQQMHSYLDINVG